MTSHSDSLTNFNGERKDEGLVFCLDVRGEPDELLGEIGGALPAGNMEGNELTPPTLTLAEIPGMLMGLPAFASSIKVFTCTQFKRFKQKSDKTNSIL
jgi:hypothetical protein